MVWILLTVQFETLQLMDFCSNLIGQQSKVSFLWLLKTLQPARAGGLWGLNSKKAQVVGGFEFLRVKFVRKLPGGGQSKRF